MKKKTVILPVETKSREFHGKLFLALHLLAKGHSVLIGEQSRLWELADLSEPGIYVDKSVAATRAEWFKRCRAMGHEIVSWDEEGLVYFDAWQYRKLRIDPKAFGRASRFFAWGEDQAEAICAEHPEYREKIALCGNPRFDFLRPGLREFYRPTAEEIRKRLGPTILVNTNFAFHNHFRSPGELRRMLAHYPLADEPGYLDGWIAMHRDAHEAYLAMVPELLARFPDHSVVVRPHPSENHAPWKELAKDRPRLQVDSSGNVHEWIMASEAVVHFNCTTAVEAFLLDVPAIAYRPGRYPKYENPLPNALSESAFTLRELWAALDGRATARERGALWTEEQRRTAARHLASIEGATAAERIAEEIGRIAGAASAGSWGLGRRAAAEAKRLWRTWLHARREARRPDDGYGAQKFPGMEEGEIRAALERMAATSGVRANYKIKAFAKNCHWLAPAGGKP